MANIKEYNLKIKSLKNTRKITKTMKMVSASKLRRAHSAQANAKLYAQNLSALTSRIAASVESASHPLFIARKTPKNVLILIITSDKGLCGSFNHSANRQVFYWIKENKNRYQKIELSFCGRRGYMFFRKLENIRSNYANTTAAPKFTDAIKIGDEIKDAFIKGEFDEVYVTYNQFFSPLFQKTTFDKILPIDAASLVGGQKSEKSDYIYEPAQAEMLNFLIPHFLYFKIYFALLENSAGEHGARMSAMDNATKNSNEMITRYTLLRNRARQAAITTELTEIVAGAEALN
jgi:F-type H+-transporting ATPase subunit gamma